MPEKTNVSRNYWMDLLNVIACFSVIVLHCSTVVFLNAGDTEWYIAVVFQCFGIFAVPVFFMISGANLLGYRHRYDTKTFFKKRFRKVVFTLVAASVIVYLARPLLYRVFGADTPYEPSFGNFAHGLLHNEICDVYWFFYAIIVLYLVTPIFSLVADNKKVMGYAVALCVLSSMVFPFIERFSPDSSFLDLFKVPYFCSWLTYYLLGYYLLHLCNLEKYSKPRVLLLGGATVFVMIALTIKTNAPHTLASGSFAAYDNFYSNALSVFALVYAVCLCILGSKSNESISEWKTYPVIRKLSGLSLGVYAIHMLVINFLDFFVPHRLLWSFGFRPFVVFALSLLLAYIGKLAMKLLRSIATKPKSVS